MTAESSQATSQKNGYTLAAFDRFCQTLTLKDGSTLTLEPFQKRILRDHFAGVVEEVVVIPKKNGKTTLFAALGLFHLTTWRKADVIIVAQAADQAGLLFEQAADMVDSSGLEHVFDVRGRYGGTYRQIRLKADPAARMRVLASDPKTVDGQLPTLALVDELHRHNTGELYGILSDGVGARHGQMITISTAGIDEESPLGLIRTRAQEAGSFRRKGTYSYAKGDDGKFVLHEWSLPDDADRENLSLVKRANPLRNNTLEELKRRRHSPMMTAGRWARYACGIWGVADDPWIEAADWDQLAVDIGGVELGEAVWVAVSTGTNPAIAWAAPREDGAVAVEVEIFKGRPSLSAVEKRLVELADSYDIREVAYGTRDFERSAELLEGRGLVMAEFPYRGPRLAAVSAVLHGLIQERKLRHSGDPELRSQVLQAVVKDTVASGAWLQPSDSARGLIAVAVAAHQATEKGQDPPKPLVLVGKVG